MSDQEVKAYNIAAPATWNQIEINESMSFSRKLKRTFINFSIDRQVNYQPSQISQQETRGCSFQIAKSSAMQPLGSEPRAC
jgi:hypothetical protein